MQARGANCQHACAIAIAGKDVGEDVVGWIDRGGWCGIVLVV